MVVRADYRLLLAVIAPLLLWPWVPPWPDAMLTYGLSGAVVFCVAVAVLEEVLFRGFLQGWLLRKTFFKSAVLGLSRANWLTSLFFSAAHLWQHPMMLVPGYLAVSLLFGHFRERYQGITVPLALHAWYNLVLLLLPKIL